MLFAGSLTGAADRVDYLRQVKPLLAARCIARHRALQQKGGLRVDTARALVEWGGDGPAIVPGASGESPLIARVIGKGGVRMPPSGEGDGLVAEQIVVLKAWIDQGAEAPSDETPEPTRAIIGPSARPCARPYPRPLRATRSTPSSPLSGRGGD